MGQKYIIIRVENLPYPCEIGDDESYFGDLGEFETFAAAVQQCKVVQSLFGNLFHETIIEDIENEIFEFKNNRGRYKNDYFKIVKDEIE